MNPVRDRVVGCCGMARQISRACLTFLKQNSCQVDARDRNPPFPGHGVAIRRALSARERYGIDESGLSEAVHAQSWCTMEVRRASIGATGAGDARF